jgi:hypothetical protein
MKIFFNRSLESLKTTQLTSAEPKTNKKKFSTFSSLTNKIVFISFFRGEGGVSFKFEHIVELKFIVYTNLGYDSGV